MSYIRFSTILNPAISFEEEMQLYKSGKNYNEVKELKLNSPNAYISDWYIYWHDNHPLDSNKKDDQLLALWNNKAGGYPIFSYDEVKEMYEKDLWEKLGDITQKDIMLDCVKRWLDDVEEDCED